MKYFTLDQFDNKNLFIIFTREASRDSTVFEHLREFCRQFKEKQFVNNNSYGTGWKIPLNRQTMEHINSHWKQHTDYDLTENALMMVTYLNVTMKLDDKRAEKRWSYLFDGENTDFQYPTAQKPFDHQRVANEAMHGYPYFALLMEMGTGKSKCVVDEIQINALTLPEGQVIRALISCPKSLRVNWQREIEKNFGDMFPYAVTILDGQIASIENLIQLVRDPARVKIAIATHDAMHRMTEQIMFYMPTYIAIDESQGFKSPDSKRWKSARMICDMPCVLQKRILTGTPVANNLPDLWPQFELLQPGILGYNTLQAFKRNFMDVKKIENAQGQDFDKIVGNKNVDELKTAVARCSFIVKKEKCLSLPERLYETRLIEMPPAVRLQYQTLEETFRLQLEDKVSVNADFIIVQMLKLSQICSGFVVADDETGDEVVRSRRLIPGGDTKLLEMIDDIVEVNDYSKLIVWARFRYDIERIVEECNKRGIEAVGFNGSTKDSDRQTYIDRFNNDARLRVFVANAGAGGTGLTLLGNQESDRDKCKVAFFYNNDFSFSKRDQAEARNHRIGQRNPVLYRDYAYEGTIETTIAAALQQKKELAEAMKDVSGVQAILRGDINAIPMVA